MQISMTGSFSVNVLGHPKEHIDKVSDQNSVRLKYSMKVY